MIQHDQIQVIRVGLSRWCSNLLVFCQNYVTYHATFHTTLLHDHFFKYTNCSFRCSLSSWFWPRPENIMFHDTSNEPNSPKTPASKKPAARFWLIIDKVEKIEEHLKWMESLIFQLVSHWVQISDVQAPLRDESWWDIDILEFEHIGTDTLPSW